MGNSYRLGGHQVKVMVTFLDLEGNDASYHKAASYYKVVFKPLLHGRVVYMFDGRVPWLDHCTKLFFGSPLDVYLDYYEKYLSFY